MLPRPIDDRLRVRLDLGHRILAAIDGVADDDADLRAHRRRHRIERGSGRGEVVLPQLHEQRNRRRGRDLEIRNRAGAERAFFRRFSGGEREDENLQSEERKRSVSLTFCKRLCRSRNCPSEKPKGSCFSIRHRA